MTCDYADGLIRLAHRLPADPRACTARFTHPGPAKVLEAVIDCR